MATTISRDQVIRQVVEAYPGIDQVFRAHGLPCTGCHVSTYETIAGGARTHSLNVDALLSDLNDYAASGAVPAAKINVINRQPNAPAAHQHIKHVIAVMSGKGGVGKSLVTGLLAVTLRRSGYRVGILDGDITGPSIPKMFGLPPKSIGNANTPPRTATGILVMSTNLMVEQEDQAVMVRGPIVARTIQQFFGEFDWGELDYLFVDLPPGTSDAPMTVMQSLPLDGVIMVSSPQGLATMVVSKAVHMAQRLQMPILGMVENMSYFIAPDSGTRYEVFGPTQGQRLVALSGAPLLGRLPIDQEIARLCDAGDIESYRSPEYQELATNFLKISEAGKETAKPGGLLKIGKILRTAGGK
ncbi:MAG TPA: P-loop NTPase [Chloroflexota bacterium]|nr:P-loop NTPase [Chloroflexota bacterium]